MNELIKQQNKSSNYLKQTAQKSTPQNNYMTVEILARAQKMVKGITDYSKIFGYDDIKNTIRLRDDINRGIKDQNSIYADKNNEMTGILNIGVTKGKAKEKQEDSILMLAHPRNEKFKLALVADGMGGYSGGDAASYIATKLTMDWFENLPESFYNSDVVNIRDQDGKIHPVKFEDYIKDNLLNINNTIVSQLGVEPGTTFSAAITKNKNGIDTISSISIGDSKILKVGEDGKVVQLSKDDNILSRGVETGNLYVDEFDSDSIYTNKRNDFYYGEEVIYKPIEKAINPTQLTKDDLRYYKKNNFITSCLGNGQTNSDFRMKLDENIHSIITEWQFNKGDKILLCSDGIADTISNSEIGDLMYTFRNSRECLKNMINIIYDRERQKQENKTNNPPKHLLNNDNFKDVLKGSGDNISGIIMEKGDDR